MYAVSKPGYYMNVTQHMPLEKATTMYKMLYASSQANLAKACLIDTKCPIRYSIM